MGIYEQAGFPKYRMASDGYPETTDIDFRLLVGYGANSDRFEDWRTNERPLQDSQQPFVRTAPLSVYPVGPATRDMLGSFQITGQVPGDGAVHTATDIALSAFGPGAWAFTGVIDNTDVFFRLAQAAVKGAVVPEGLTALSRPGPAPLAANRAEPPWQEGVDCHGSVTNVSYIGPTANRTQIPEILSPER